MSVQSRATVTHRRPDALNLQRRSYGEAHERKVVLITGGSSGIGRAAALFIARAGASVVLAARGAERGEKVEQEINAIGAKALFVQADVSDSSQVQSLIAQAVGRSGRLDLAFNNAAVPNKTARTGDYKERDFDTEVSSNLKSVWLSMKYELGQMRKQQPAKGAIVNTSSVNGLGGVANAALYAMSKAGILALTKSAAQEYAAHRIWVNALVAGGFDTEMLQTVVSRMAAGDPAKVEEAFKRYAALVPVGVLAGLRRPPELSCGS